MRRVLVLGDVVERVNARRRLRGGGRLQLVLVTLLHDRTAKCKVQSTHAPDDVTSRSPRLQMGQRSNLSSGSLLRRFTSFTLNDGVTSLAPATRSSLKYMRVNFAPD